MLPCLALMRICTSSGLPKFRCLRKVSVIGSLLGTKSENTVRTATRLQPNPKKTVSSAMNATYAQLDRTNVSASFCAPLLLFWSCSILQGPAEIGPPNTALSRDQHAFGVSWENA